MHAYVCACMCACKYVCARACSVCYMKIQQTVILPIKNTHHEYNCTKIKNNFFQQLFNYLFNTFVCYKFYRVHLDMPNSTVACTKQTEREVTDQVNQRLPTAGYIKPGKCYQHRHGNNSDSLELPRHNLDWSRCYCPIPVLGVCV